MRLAAEKRGAWTTIAHVGAPFLMLGNGYLFNALQGLRRGDDGQLDCAIAAYRRALKFVRTVDNQELYAALSNNLGAALAIKGALHSQQNLVDRGLKRIELAMLSAIAGRGKTAGFSAGGVARHNFQMLRLGGTSKQRRKQG